uniref:Uncharacterized protein n=1 Tax=Amphimedon queenslandica TaxID=400682 RepID=A0A1X7UIY3_AMPQE
MSQISPVPTGPQSSHTPFIYPDLKADKFVPIGHDASRSSLQPAYDGPFPVIDLYDKFFTVDINGDRLKSAFTETDLVQDSYDTNNLVLTQHPQTNHSSPIFPPSNLSPPTTRYGSRICPSVTIQLHPLLNS